MHKYLTHISSNIGDIQSSHADKNYNVTVGSHRMEHIPLLRYRYLVSGEGFDTTSKYLIPYGDTYHTRGSFVFERLHKGFGLRIIQPGVDIRNSYDSPRTVKELSNKMYNKGGIPHLSGSPCTGNMSRIRDQLNGLIDQRLVDLKVYEQFINSRNLMDGAGECIYLEDYLSLQGIVAALGDSHYDSMGKATLVSVLNYFLEEGIYITYYGNLGDEFENWLSCMDTSEGYIQFNDYVRQPYHTVQFTNRDDWGIGSYISSDCLDAANAFLRSRYEATHR